jgi:hypothetical protein
MISIEAGIQIDRNDEHSENILRGICVNFESDSNTNAKRTCNDRNTPHQGFHQMQGFKSISILNSYRIIECPVTNLRQFRIRFD